MLMLHLNSSQLFVSVRLRTCNVIRKVIEFFTDCEVEALSKNKKLEREGDQGPGDGIRSQVLPSTARAVQIVRSEVF